MGVDRLQDVQTGLHLLFLAEGTPVAGLGRFDWGLVDVRTRLVLDSCFGRCFVPWCDPSRDPFGGSCCEP